MPLLPTRFVVLCGTRTGSTLLGSLLAAHPQLAWGGEYYKGLIRAARHGPRPRLVLGLARHIPAAYLTWTALRSHRPVYGCKLTPGYVSDVESAIAQLHHSGWRLILLQRQDVFRGVLSAIVAKSTRHWRSLKDGVTPEAPRLTVEPAVFLKKLGDRVQQDQLKQRSVAGRPHLRVNYEDDLAEAACWPATMARVFGYLGLPNVPVQSAVNKTWDRAYQHIIVNYAELEEAVRGSKWADVLSSTQVAIPGDPVWVKE